MTLNNIRRVRLCHLFLAVCIPLSVSALAPHQPTIVQAQVGNLLTAPTNDAIRAFAIGGAITSTLPTAVRSLAYSPSRDRLYATLEPEFGSAVGRVVEINPTDGSTIDLPAEGVPTVVAVSGDGRYLYYATRIQSPDAKYVHRIDLDLRAISLRYVGVVTDTTTNAPPLIDGLLSVPDRPGSVVVMQSESSSGSPGRGRVVVFDDGQPRARVAHHDSWLADPAFMDATTLWGVGQRELYRLALVSDGITLTSSTTLTGTPMGSADYHQGRVYTLYGQVFDGATGALLWSYEGSTGMTCCFPRLDRDRRWLYSNTDGRVEVYDLDSSRRLGAVAVPVSLSSGMYAAGAGRFAILNEFRGSVTVYSMVPLTASAFLPSLIRQATR